MPYNQRFIYLPVADQELEGALTSNVAITKHHNTAKAYHRLYPNQGQELRFVSGTDMLLVLGHANLGKGIGTHAKFYGARKLAKLMQEDGLTDRDFTIKLFSCNSAVLMPGQKAPYAERFAKALSDLGYKLPKVQGYTGFAYLTKTLGQQDRKAVVENIAVSLPSGKVTTNNKTDEFAKTNRATWQLGPDGVQRTEGGAFEMERKWKSFKLLWTLKAA